MEQRRTVKIRQILKITLSEYFTKLQQITILEFSVLAIMVTFFYFKDILVDIAKNANLRKIKRDHVIVWQGQEGRQ